MRKLFGLAAAMGLFLGVAQPAHAVMQNLSSASLTLTISALPSIGITWNNTGAADVTATSISGLSAGIFNFTGSLVVTDAAAFPIKGLAMVNVSNSIGNFLNVDTTSGGGPMAVTGVANVCLFKACSGPPANVVVPFTEGGVNGIGLGGEPIIVGGDALVLLTIPGNQWTTGERSIQVASDAATPDVPKFITQSGSPLDASGHIKLISPTTLSTNIGASATLPMFAIMELQFEQVVPEPGTLLLLASGVAGLAMVGRKRMSK